MNNPSTQKDTTEKPLVLFQEGLLSSITVDHDLWMRGNPDENIIERYRSNYSRGVKFPPIVVFADGATLRLVDGFLRFEAAKRAGLSSLPMEIHKGSRRDALRYSLSANQFNKVSRKEKHDVVM